METKRCRGYDREPHMEILASFAVNRSNNDGLQRLCRECHSAAMKAHYRRVKELSPEAVAQHRRSGMKRCYRCESAGRDPVRPLDDFHESSNTQDRKRNHCKDCVRELRWQRWGIIGMTVERFESMLAEQDYRCAIPSCKTINTRVLDVDHDHATGEVRGLLCRNCNIVAGKVRESTEILADLIRYLNGDISLEPLLK